MVIFVLPTLKGMIWVSWNDENDMLWGVPRTREPKKSFFFDGQSIYKWMTGGTPMTCRKPPWPVGSFLGMILGIFHGGSLWL